MPAVYPAAVKSFVDKTDLTDVNYAAHINDLQNEVHAIEAELGVNPSGSTSTVAQRLSDMDTAVVAAALPQSHSLLTALANDDHTQYLTMGRHDLSARHGIGTVIPVGTPTQVGIANAQGSAASVARSDHVHRASALIGDITGIAPSSPALGQPLVFNGANFVNANIVQHYGSAINTAGGTVFTTNGTNQSAYIPWTGHGPGHQYWQGAGDTTTLKVLHDGLYLIFYNIPFIVPVSAHGDLPEVYTYVSVNGGVAGGVCHLPYFSSVVYGTGITTFVQGMSAYALTTTDAVRIVLHSRSGNLSGKNLDMNGGFLINPFITLTMIDTKYV